MAKLVVDSQIHSELIDVTKVVTSLFPERGEEVKVDINLMISSAAIIYIHIYTLEVWMGHVKGKCD